MGPLDFGEWMKTCTTAEWVEATASSRTETGSLRLTGGGPDPRCRYPVSLVQDTRCDREFAHDGTHRDANGRERLRGDNERW